MKFLAIVAWNDTSFRLNKYQDYPTEAEAAAHVERVKDRFPNAFVAPHPGDGPANWLINPGAKTLSVVPLPPPPDRTAEDIDAAFKGDALAGLLGEVAELKGVTEAQLIASIKARRGA